jgi:hypothetical protein
MAQKDPVACIARLQAGSEPIGPIARVDSKLTIFKFPVHPAERNEYVVYQGSDLLVFIP